MSNKKILIVCPYPKGKAANQRFRFEQYLDFEDVSFTQVSFWQESEWPRIYEEGSTSYKVISTLKGFWRRFRLLFQVSKYDQVFVHREATPIGPPWFEWVVAKIWRKPLFLDFDDAIWLPNSSKANEKLAGKLKFHEKTAKICSWATTVVTGNQFLADYAKQFCADVRIIPTTIDTEHHHNPDLYKKIGTKWFKNTEVLSPNTNLSISTPPNTQYSKPDTIPTIGWTGTHSTLKQLVPLFTVLEGVYLTHPFRFLLIADVPPDEIPDFVEFRKWKKETEIEDLLEMDIGVMPLYDTDWEKGKCGFKALQYMALGIPTIVSDVGVNSEIIGSSNYGLLAEATPFSDQTKWTKALTDLLENSDLRNELGTKGKTRVINSYSVLAFTEDYSSLFKPSVSGKNP